MARGKIRLVLRNPDDVAVVEAAPETTIADLVELERRERLQRRPLPRTAPTTPTTPASQEPARAVEIQ
jgi:hypothetical protein